MMDTDSGMFFLTTRIGYHYADPLDMKSVAQICNNTRALPLPFVTKKSEFLTK
jgi:hypothetical protein